MEPTSDATPGFYQLGLPPIVGSEGGSAWAGEGGHVSQDQVAFGPDFLSGMSIMLDAQADGYGEQIVLGGVDSAGELKLTLNDSGADGRIRLRIRDGAGARLDSYANLSMGAARRVLLTVAPLIPEVRVYELHPWLLLRVHLSRVRHHSKESSNA